MKTWSRDPRVPADPGLSITETGSPSRRRDTESREDPRDGRKPPAQSQRAGSGSFLWKTAAVPGPRGRERHR